MVAEEGLEPTTFGLWARRATNCSTPRYIRVFCLTFLFLITRTGYLSFGKPPCSIQKFLRTFVLVLFDCYGISPSPSSATGSGLDKSQRATNCSTPRYITLCSLWKLLHYSMIWIFCQPFFVKKIANYFDTNCTLSKKINKKEPFGSFLHFYHLITLFAPM